MTLDKWIAEARRKKSSHLLIIEDSQTGETYPFYVNRKDRLQKLKDHFINDRQNQRIVNVIDVNEHNDHTTYITKNMYKKQFYPHLQIKDPSNFSLLKPAFNLTSNNMSVTEKNKEMPSRQRHWEPY